MSYSILSLACENTRFSSLFAAGDVWRGGKKEKRREFPPVPSCFIFVLALSHFRGPDYIGAWNTLAILL